MLLHISAEKIHSCVRRMISVLFCMLPYVAYVLLRMERVCKVKGLHILLGVLIVANDDASVVTFSLQRKHFYVLLHHKNAIFIGPYALLCNNYRVVIHVDQEQYRVYIPHSHTYGQVVIISSSYILLAFDNLAECTCP